jgi:glycylpeptide N-tetradecanoyltransferase
VKTFRFKYSAPFLKWALTPPNYIKDWMIGLRVKQNQKLVGFISGVPLKVNLEGKSINMAEINFLCVHSKLRTKRMAPVLIKEVTRRINMKEVWQAIYTGGKYIPTPISESNYYYRILNFKKMNDVCFIRLIFVDWLCLHST